jgi:hypothetical protein
MIELCIAPEAATLNMAIISNHICNCGSSFYKVPKVFFTSDQELVMIMGRSLGLKSRL